MNQSDVQQPNWKLPLILSTILAAGGTFVYWHQYNHKPKQEKAETLEKKPLGLPSEDTQIAMIKVKTAKGLIELKCQDLASKNCKVGAAGKWKVTHPAEYAGDNESVKDFLNSAANVLATETVDLKEETPEKRQKLLDEYGLSDQKRTDLNTQFIELVAEDGKRYTAWFGVEHPIGDKYFVARSVDGKINDQTIFLISSYYKNNLAKDLTYFRDKTLFTFNRGDVDSFEATTTHGKLSGKKVNGMWEVNGLPGDADKIETALSQIGKAQAKDFPQPDAYQGAKRIVRYDLKSKDKSYWIELLDKTEKAAGSKAPSTHKYFAKVSTRPETVEMDSMLVTQIDKKLNELRQQSVLADAVKANSDQLTLEFKGGKSPMQFEYKNNAWTAKDPASKADANKARTLLDTISQAHVEDFLASAPAGKEEVTVTLGDAKNPQKFKMRFLSTKDKVYAIDLNSKRKEVLQMNDTMKSALPFTEDSWKIK